jgi:hypothetical protein
MRGFGTRFAVLGGGSIAGIGQKSLSLEALWNLVTMSKSNPAATLVFAARKKLAK